MDAAARDQRRQAPADPERGQGRPGRAPPRQRPRPRGPLTDPGRRQSPGLTSVWAGVELERGNLTKMNCLNQQRLRCSLGASLSFQRPRRRGWEDCGWEWARRGGGGGEPQ